MLHTALDAGVSPETLRKIESGRVATPAFPTIAAIADVLGLSLDAVWSEINKSDGGAELAPTGAHRARAAGLLARSSGRPVVRGEPRMRSGTE